MSYSVKEIYYTLQGEGANTGRPAVFCRFSGCNLWTGREEDRDRAVCQFCDTDFVGVDGPGGGRFDNAVGLADAIAEHWPRSPARGSSRSEAKAERALPTRPMVVCTGGEPFLQLDETAVEAIHDRGFQIAVETNGTQRPPAGLDWICVSPKAGADWVLNSGDELKLVYPQPDLLPGDLEVDELDFEHFFLQPMDGPDRAENTRRAVEYCLEHPEWRLSLQTHKFIGIE